VEVVFRDGTTSYADYIIGRDERADLAVLLLPSGDKGDAFVEPAEDEPDIGERIFVIGNPEGLGWTLSEGIISAYREFSGIGLRIQMSADVSEGSSGSPVFNMKGEVVGIVQGSYRTGQRLNFAIPTATLQKLLSTEVAPTLRMMADDARKEAQKKEASPPPKPPIDFSDANTKPAWSEYRGTPTVKMARVVSGWADTEVYVLKGQFVRIYTSGEMTLSNKYISTPDGIKAFDDKTRPMPSQATGTLIGVIGEDESDFILIGSRREFIAEKSGILYHYAEITERRKTTSDFKPDR
jgi:hypothetical protein